MRQYQEIRKKTIIVDVDGVLAKFVKFFQADSNLHIRMAPKLTLKHIDLPMFTKI